MKNVREFSELKNSLARQKRNPLQVNGLFESDCETVKLGKRNYLVTSIDSISEEIDLGLYKEIETWAWITVMSSVSDLCASGATPIGLTLSTLWKFGTDESKKAEFFHCAHKAMKAADVCLLGGDSGSSGSHAFCASIIGTSAKRPLMRTGAAEGDYLVLLHQNNLGVGPSLAYRFLACAPAELMPEKIFRPVPSWKKAQAIAPFASASIDTSDGIATSVSLLCQINKLGVDLFWDDKILHPKALAAMKAISLSPLFLWLGDHGDFHTLFVVPEKNLKKLPKSVHYSVIGQLKKKRETKLHYHNQLIDFPVEKVTSVARELDAYRALIKELSLKFPV